MCSKKAYDIRSSNLAILLSTTCKSYCFSVCNTETSSLEPVIMSPLLVSAKSFLRVTALGLTKNTTLLEAAALSTSACDKPSNDFKSPKNSSTKLLP